MQHPSLNLPVIKEPEQKTVNDVNTAATLETLTPLIEQLTILDAEETRLFNLLIKKTIGEVK